jgi:hypothetical protein
MQQTHWILQGDRGIRSDTWFQMTGESDRRTRARIAPWNIRKQPARLEIRRNFFSNRVVEPHRGI